MKLLYFEVKSSVAHFRRPDTTSTHATYPFITRTAIQGLLAAVMGWESWSGSLWSGVELLSPPVTKVQQLSMLGKGFLDKDGDIFNRPTTVELLVNPHYRIFVAGDHLDALAERLASNRSVYHTYLGSAFALTVPFAVGVDDVEPLPPTTSDSWSARTVLPVHAVQALEATAGAQFARVGGIPYEILPGRRFRGSVAVLYEKRGRPIEFYPSTGPFAPEVRFVPWQGQVVALW
ncbi:MAG: CRISPR-associated protein Cas5 [Firmicutes bacterium]|nr:CRISPR-associated protein Cas5 [Alicyclobacillaceae bacterium]MCL6498046.1 CRISPR-associated protein Cas5 [Bacillota bacterium]